MRTPTEQKITVKQDPANEIAVEILAADIEKIANAAEALLASRLKNRTVCMLISKMSGVGMKDVEYVLNSARTLAKEYLK